MIGLYVHTAFHPSTMSDSTLNLSMLVMPRADLQFTIAIFFVAED